MPKTPRKPRALVVAGDVTVDWLVRPDFDWLAAARESGGAPTGEGVRIQSWQLRRGTRMEAHPGGALLLAHAIQLALRHDTDRPAIRTHRLLDLRKVSPDRVLHSLVELEPDSFTRGRSLRVSRFLGFSGPLHGAPAPLPLPADDPAADLVVLDDAGNGFRDHPESWPRSLTAPGRTPVVVMKMSRPLSGGALFERVRAAHRERLILVINADDLRAEGVDLSRQLSWERSARDFLWQMRHNPDLELLRQLPALLVRFDLDGVIHYQGAGAAPEARLFYDPASAEGGWRERRGGGMLGLTDVFVAALTARMFRAGPAALSDGIREGILAARRCFLRGIDARNMGYPVAEIFAAAEEDGLIVDAAIPPSRRREAADPDFWSLLRDLPGPGLEHLARHLVADGETAALRTVPVGQFGDLRTVDRTEIESFRGIRNLIAEYLSRPAKRPLSIAVFGPPGSGKSFGVEQVAQSVARLTSVRVVKLELNLSQIESAHDLVATFHRVRDEVVRGRVPLVFFDEFDSPREGPLGWLRFFLAPMHDGAFKDGESMHPIGRAIFVFAGGLSDTLARFAREEFPETTPPAIQQRERELFRGAKGPDFVSRLRGYVNVLGPNPDERRPDDRLFLIRRATILRSLLQRNCPHLADPQRPGRLRIDEGVLRALIGVPHYRHGVRSMEAIIDMSRLEGRGNFEPAALPPPDQLDQHVSATAFTQLVRQGILFAAARDAIAEALHENYRAGRGGRRRDPALAPWSRLDEVYRRSNLAQADDILRKLEAIGYGIRVRGDHRGAAFRFSREEIERLAELEHERYLEERVREGFTPGPVRSLRRKTSPFLVPWSRLSEAARRLDRDAVKAIPGVLARAGFEVHRVT